MVHAGEWGGAGGKGRGGVGKGHVVPGPHGQTGGGKRGGGGKRVTGEGGTIDNFLHTKW